MVGYNSSAEQIQKIPMKKLKVHKRQRITNSYTFNKPDEDCLCCTKNECHNPIRESKCHEHCEGYETNRNRNKLLIINQQVLLLCQSYTFYIPLELLWFDYCLDFHYFGVIQEY